MTIAPGSHLGPYEITSQVGAGGMGVIYRAKDTRLGREVAIKVLPPAFAEDAERLRRFEQEARTTSSLSHPNILSVFDTGVHEGSPYLVMELLDGANLRERMDGQALPLRKAVEIARSVAEALAAAHGKGIIHRDIKPENVFLTKDGRVKVLDFGLAKYRELVLGNNQSNLPTNAVVSGETGAGALLGTVGYMAPEQVNGGAVDARTDLFALGITLYEMVSGRRAFKGDSTIETLHAILKAEPPDFLPELKVPPVLERVIRRCLEKEPEARFQSARDLAFALEHLGSTSQTSETGAASVVLPLSRQNRWLSPAALSLGLVVIGVLGFYLGTQRTPGPSYKMEPLLPFPMAVTSARFMPDGKRVVFSANTAECENELFLYTPGEPAPRPLGVKNARVLAVSPRGEIALDWTTAQKRVLAVLGAPGLAPKITDEQIVSAAIWDAEGKDMILKYWRYENKPTQAFVYRGKLLYRVPYGFGVGGFTLTPDGKSICFAEKRPDKYVLNVIGLDGHIRSQANLSKSHPQYLVNAADKIMGIDVTVNALINVNESGINSNRFMTIAGDTQLLDGGLDGSILMTSLARDMQVVRTWWKYPGQMDPRQVAASNVVSNPLLSQGGKRLGVAQEGNDREESWLYSNESTELVPVGEGRISALSDDGEVALLLRPSMKGGRTLIVVPTGAGKTVEVPGDWVQLRSYFFKDGQHALLYGGEVDSTDFEWNSYLLDTRTGQLKPLAFKANGPLTEDGTWAFSPPEKNALALHSRINLVNGERIPLPISCVDRVPIGWSGSGQEIWTLKYSKGTRYGRGFPVELAKVALSNGKLLSSQILRGSGTIGADFGTATITRDGRSFAFTESVPCMDPVMLYRLSPVGVSH